MKFIRCVSRSLRRMKWTLVLLDLAADQRSNDMVISKVISRWWMMHRPMPTGSATIPVGSVRMPPVAAGHASDYLREWQPCHLKIGVFEVKSILA
eukprot:5531453-Heterocapsa_arctica.AAC.1